MSDTAVMTLTEFLTARLDEDEARAHAAASTAAPPWWWGDAPLGDRFRYGLLGRNPFGHPAPTWIIPSVSGDMWPDRDTAAHIARHDPARVLAEVAAKRRIVELHKSWPVLVQRPMEFETDSTDRMVFRATQQMAWLTEQEYRTRFGDEPPTSPIIRALASVYADHPDYDPEWTP